MRLAHGEFARLDAVGRLDPDLFDVLGREPISVAVLVSEWTSRIVERFEVDVRQIRCVVSADPAAVFVVSDVGQRKTKARVTGEVPTFVAVNMTFVNLARTKEGKVRVDEKHRVAGRALGWADDPAIRTGVLL